MTGRYPAGTEDFPSRLPRRRLPTATAKHHHRAYKDSLDRIRGTDDLSLHLLRGLPARRNPTSAQTSTRAALDDLGGFRFTAGQRPTRPESTFLRGPLAPGAVTVGGAELVVGSAFVLADQSSVV